jgi:ABC-2 type transport system ATP-binding protein
VRDRRTEQAHDSPLGPGGLPPFLQVTNISKTYRRQTALRGVSFMVSPGEIVGLVGPNGAGKSTTLRIICGLLRPDSGGVAIDGIDQLREPGRYRSRLGALIEAPACYPSLTAFDHLAYLARIRGCYDPGVLELVLADVGLPPRSKKTVRQFSLGMKQRLGIAMAVLDSPGLLVLDEPMNGLDPIGMTELRERLRVLADRDRWRSWCRATSCTKSNRFAIACSSSGRVGSSMRRHSLAIRPTRILRSCW